MADMSEPLHFHRLLASVRESLPDAQGERIRRAVSEDLGFDPGPVRSLRVLEIFGRFSESEARRIAVELFADPIVDELSTNGALLARPGKIFAKVSLRYGVTDNEARSAAEAIGLMFGRELAPDEEIFSSRIIRFQKGISRKQLDQMTSQILHNSLIETVEILNSDELAAGREFSRPEPSKPMDPPAVETVPVTTLDDAALRQLSRARGLSLSLDEMRAIRQHYRDQRDIRVRSGLPVEPTDVELEVVAQTWSEHCKHKIFAAHIEYSDGESGEREEINGLFKTLIAAPTHQMMKKRKDIASVFSDNAGVFHFDAEHDICIKAETHNSPSALEPYGGAMTGIVGVNRDVLGTGRGFLPIFNTDVFCFAPPNHQEELPKGLLHPRRIMRGVHRGVMTGGNESGIPTVNGSFNFDKRYMGKPLVFCGTGGIAPRMLHGKPIHEKWISPGDRIVMIGGRIGKDGIHGATFSSEGLSSASPSSAVQIGDPITQKRMTDFLICARDLGLYGHLTDNGAGGLSSSIGEMATVCGGARLDLSLAPLKYPGLAPWEIFLSEAQERMSLAVPPDKLKALLDLARHMKVLAVDLGEFSDSGCLDLYYADRHVGRLDMAFLHDGCPRMLLRAHWQAPQHPEPSDAELPGFDQDLISRVLSRHNICSKEDWVRQYDHEVQGMSIIKPFCGRDGNGPSDAAVLRPVRGSTRGLAVAHGLRARASDIDAYAMTAIAIDEALASLVAVGADPDQALGLDNFCWPDPLEGQRNPDAAFKLAQLVRSCKALRDVCLTYNMPCISGKDSMKNDYLGDDIKISIPPTLLYTATAIVPDVRYAIGSDFRRHGDVIYLVGPTRDELGASELYDMLGITGKNVPIVCPDEALARYRSLYRLISNGLIRSCHDLSEGGLLVALAESCFGGRLGAALELGPHELGDLHPVRYFFSESPSRLLISVAPEHAAAVAAELQPHRLQRLGTVSESYTLGLGEYGHYDLHELYLSWRLPLALAP